MKPSRLAACLPLLSLASAAAPAMAARPTQAAAPVLSLQQAVEQAQQASGGTVLSAVRQDRENRSEYRIKVLTADGHVKVLTVVGGPHGPSVIDPTVNPAGGPGKKEKR